MKLLQKTRRGNPAQTHQQGVAAIEFALLIVLLLAIVSGVIEFGKVFWYYDTLAKSTRDSARFLSLSRISSTEAITQAFLDDAKDKVVAVASAAGIPADFTAEDVEVECDPDCDAPDYVTVRIDAYPVTIGGWIPIFIPTGTTTWSRTLSPYTTMRYMR